MAVHSVGSLERSVRAMAILLIMAGDVERNPGPLLPSSESRALRHHFASLVTAITDPLMLSSKLYSKGIIEKATKDKANFPTQTTEEKNDVLLSAVTIKVNTDPSFFHCFVDLLKNEEDDNLKSLGEKLKDTYNKIAKEDTEQHTLDLPPAKRPKFSPSQIREQVLQPHCQPSQPQSLTQPSQPQPSQPHSQLTLHLCGAEHVNEPPTVKPGMNPLRVKQPKTDHKESKNISTLPTINPGIDPSKNKLPKAKNRSRENVSEPQMSVDQSGTAADHKDRESASEPSVVKFGVEDMETEQLKSDSCNLSLIEYHRDSALATASHTEESLDLGESSKSMETAFLMLLPGCKYAGEALPEHVNLITPQDVVKYKTPGNVWFPVEHSHIRGICWLVLTSPSVLQQKQFKLPPLTLPFTFRFPISMRPARNSLEKSILYACMTRDMREVESFPQNCELLCSVCLTGWLDLLMILVEQTPHLVNKLLDKLVYCACCSGNVSIVKYLVNKCSFSFHQKRMNPLHAACCRGSLDIVKFLLDGKHCSVDSLDCFVSLFTSIDYNATALHYASFFGHMDIVEYLISQYYTVGITIPLHTSSRHRRRRGKNRKSKDLALKLCHTLDSNGNTPLHLAVGGGHTEIVKFLIARELFSADSGNHHGNTPLFIACAKGYTDIVKFLLTKNHCEANLANSDGNTPLLVSCEKGDVDIVTFLLTEDYCTADCVNKLGNTPLLLACENGHIEIVKFLISGKYCTADCENSIGNTPLLVSCEKGHTEIVKYLLTGEHCTADCVNESGSNPLLVSCKNGHTEIVRFLLSENYCTAGENCDTYLFLACRNGHTEIVKFLTGKYCAVDCTDENGNSLLHLACEGRSLEMVKFLITKHHALTKCVNEGQNTPLHLVCKGRISPPTSYFYTSSRYLHPRFSDQQNKGYVRDIVQLLVSNGLSPTTKGHNGNTALHYACEQQLPEAVKYFFEQCDLSTCGTWANNDGNTPLHLACKNVSFSGEVISYLVKSGQIDPLAFNCQGKTAMDIMLSEGSATQTSEGASILAYYHKNAKIHGSLEPAMKLFVLGNPRIGKTTLVRAIRVLNSLPAGMATFINVTGSEPTAGIDVVGFRDEQFGPVSVHDLAGQKEYYASHDALIQNLITASVAIFVITVKLADSDDIIRKSLQYWMSFIDNCCSRVQATGRVIIVGSWADEVPISAEEFSHKWTDEIKSTFHVTIVGFVPLDCRLIELDGLNYFRKLVQESCEALQLQSSERPFTSHECAVYAFILEHLQNKVACMVNELADYISQSELNTTLPTELNILSHILSGLSDGGLLLYLPNKEDVGAGWVILRRETLLSDINGTIFAPENFKKQFKFDTSTGVVSEATLSQAFQGIDPRMIVQVMTHFEFCQRIEDPATVSLILNASGHCISAHTVSESPLSSYSESSSNMPNEGLPSEQYYFFPALVHTDYPEHLLETSTHDVIDEESQEYRSGWCIECMKEGQYLSPHFIHVLLLRLAFSFALAPSTTYHKDSPVIRRHCTVWRNGIQWLNDDGTKVLVEVIDQKQCVLIIKGEEEMVLIKQRSSIIAEIVNIKREYCPCVCMEESILDLTHSPSNSIAVTAKTIRQKSHELTWYRVADIANAVSRQKPYVINPHQMKIEKLVYHEPYVGLRQSVICELFEQERHGDVIDDGFLLQFAEDLCKTYQESAKTCDNLAKMLSLPSSYQLDNSYFNLLKIWRTNVSSNGTFSSLRSVLDNHSIFCGRNPMTYTEMERKQMSAKLKSPERICTASAGPVQPSSAINYRARTSASSTHHSLSTPSRGESSLSGQARLDQLGRTGFSHPREGQNVLLIEVTPAELAAIKQLVSCGYPDEQVTRAYFESGKDVEAAKLWLIENAKCTQRRQHFGRYSVYYTQDGIL